MTRVVLGGTALLAVVLVLDQQAPRQPVFRAGVDVVLGDAYVVDRQGRPVTDLALADFEIAVDRRSRRVVSADLLRVGAERPEAVPGSATIADASGAVTPAHRHRPRIGRRGEVTVRSRAMVTIPPARP